MADDGAEGFKNWFEVVDNESSGKCSELSYSLEEKDGEDFVPLKGTDKAEIVNNKYLQINLKTEYEATVYLTATSIGGKSARRELVIQSKAEGPPPVIADPAPQKPCGECAGENLSKICTNTKEEKPTGACCVQGDTSPACTEGGDVTCSPMLLKAQAMFYTYCPMNNEEACGGKNFAAGSGTSSFEFGGISALADDDEPKNDACTYDIAAPEETF
jgi:hypothetical protein